MSLFSKASAMGSGHAHRVMMAAKHAQRPLCAVPGWGFKGEACETYRKDSECNGSNACGSVNRPPALPILDLGEIVSFQILPSRWVRSVWLEYMSSES